MQCWHCVQRLKNIVTAQVRSEHGTDSEAHIWASESVLFTAFCFISLNYPVAIQVLHTWASVACLNSGTLKNKLYHKTNYTTHLQTWFRNVSNQHWNVFIEYFQSTYTVCSEFNLNISYLVIAKGDFKNHLLITN